ncbi:hypothetical protein [Pontibacter virosus]|uniref:Uncharacterized protein n=1 Tax=Pontibacter virosus TaxID=1765052 RepID=A0A2U1ARC2_9BACT|nr:hypothetical protein [Pontibacter virosus]PVY38945.1 hypothetical protein C8E01_114113 [Pontibacter virosus]
MKHIVYKIKKAGTENDFMHHDKQTFSDDVSKQKVYTSENSVDKVADSFESKGIGVEVIEFYLVERDVEAEYKQEQEIAAASLLPEHRNEEFVNITLKEAAELLRNELQKIKYYHNEEKLDTSQMTYYYSEDNYEDDIYNITFCEGEDEGEPVGECLVEAVPFIEDKKLMMHCITYSNIKAIDRKGRENRDAFYAIEIDIKSYIMLRDRNIQLKELLSDEEFMNS